MRLVANRTDSVNITAFGIICTDIPVTQMLIIRSLITLCLLVVCAAAQQPETIATSSLKAYTAADLPTEARTAWEQRDRSFAQAREQLLSHYVTDVVVGLEAASLGTTSAKLIDRQRKKIPDPSEAQIQAIYQANQQALENKPINDVRPTIIRYLRREPEEMQLKSYAEELAAKYKISYQNDINAPGLKPTDILFTAGGKAITVQDFENKYRMAEYDAKASLIDDINDVLTGMIMTNLIDAEAAALKLDAQTYIAREVTDKLKQSTDDEKAALESALKNRLFAKYKVKFLLTPPTPIVQQISVDDDPAKGPANAPVTVVMFGDFQCSACSRTHPILQKVIAEFPGKIHFVARDFPLETIHENAYRAALAANAANAQGKFWEYGELLYHNQDTLDDASLKKYAMQLGLNVRQFEIDFTSEKAAAEVRKDVDDGISYGVTGTPSIFVNGVMVRRLTEEDIRETIQNALKTSSPAAVRQSRQ